MGNFMGFGLAGMVWQRRGEVKPASAAGVMVWRGKAVLYVL
jgi:hypothetical protein